MLCEKMKIQRSEFRKIAKLIRSSDVYDVYDLSYLENLVVSMTILHANKETSGHSHENAEEVYFFLEGNGEMQLGNEKFSVTKDDIVLIPKNQFHKVFNKSNSDLIFICIFEKYEGRG